MTKINFRKNLFYGFMVVFSLSVFAFMVKAHGSKQASHSSMAITHTGTVLEADGKKTETQISPFKHNKKYTVKTFDDNKFDYKKVFFENTIAKHANKQSNEDTVIYMSAIGGKDSYGQGKSFRDLFSNLNSLEHPRRLVSYGISVGEPEEFEKIKAFFEEYFNHMTDADSETDNFISKVTLVSAPFIDREFESLSRADRKSDRVQRLRRRSIARARNFLLFNCLKDERYTFFIDADITHIEHSKMLKEFITSDKDIVVPRIIREDLNDYDKNSWRGERSVPNEIQLQEMDNNNWDNWDYTPMPVEGRTYFLGDFIRETESLPENDEKRQLSYQIPLDSVGGCILFVKSIIFKQGVTFPPNYVIGTTWKRLEGYDGIETEGICYIAKSMGYSCWGMPNLVAQHSAD